MENKLLMVPGQGNSLWDSAPQAHRAHRQQGGPLTQLFQPHSSFCSFLWLREAEASPEPRPPSTASNWLPLPLTAPEQQPSPPPQPGSVPFPFMVKLRERSEGGVVSGWAKACKARMPHPQPETLGHLPPSSFFLLSDQLCLQFTTPLACPTPSSPPLPSPLHPGG